MSNKTFAMALTKIVSEAEAIKREEIEHGIPMERRARVFGRVRGVFVLLFLVTSAYFAYTYREDMVSFYAPNMDDQMEGKASNALQNAGQNAVYRDKVVDDVSK
jgi:hypothetical protein